MPFVAWNSGRTTVNSNTNVIGMKVIIIKKQPISRKDRGKNVRRRRIFRHENISDMENITLIMMLLFQIIYFNTFNQYKQIFKNLC